MAATAKQITPMITRSRSSKTPPEAPPAVPKELKSSLATPSSLPLKSQETTTAAKTVSSDSATKVSTNTIPTPSSVVRDLARSTDSASSTSENRNSEPASVSGLKDSLPSDNDAQTKDKTLKVASTTADNSSAAASASQIEKQPAVNGIDGGKPGVMEFMDFVQPEPAIKVSHF